MKRIIFLVCLSLLFCASAGFAGEQKAADYSAHFTDMDANKDDAVSWDEFKAHLTHAQKTVFEEADADKNGKLDHEELHEFKDKHGYGCQEEHQGKE